MDRFSKILKYAQFNRDLNPVLDLILEKIETINEEFRADQIYKIIENNFKRLKVSFLFAVYDEKNKHIIIKQYHTNNEKFSAQLSRNKNKLINQRIPISKVTNYEKVIRDGKAIFQENITQHLKQCFPYIDTSKFTYVNSITVPLIIKKKKIAAIEFFSSDIQKIHLKIFSDFAQDLAELITNLTLFQEIKKSENYINHIFEGAGEGFVVYDESKNIIKKSNARIRTISGYNADELQNLSFYNLFEKREKERVRAFIKINLKKGVHEDNLPIYLKTKLITKKKKIKYITLTVVKTLNNFEWFFIFNDITAYKKTETALKESNWRYKKLWDNAPVAYHIIDNEGKIIDVNRTEAKMLGYKKREMVGKVIFDFILPQQRRDAVKRHASKISGENIVRFKDRVYVKKDGSKIYVSSEDSLEKNKKGEVVRINTTMIDITQSKLAEEKSKKGYKIQSILNEILKISLKDIGLEKKLEKILAEIFSYSWQSLAPGGGIWLAQTEDSKKLILKAHQGLSKEIIDKHQELVRGTCICSKTKEKFLNRYHPEKKFVECFLPNRHYCIPINLKGDTVGIINFFLKKKNTDKDELKFIQSVSNILANIVEKCYARKNIEETEVMYRDLLNNALDMVLTINKYGFITFANRSFFKTCGYDKKDLLHLKLLNVIHQDDLPLATKMIERNLSAKIIAAHDLKLKTKKGKTLYTNCNFTPLVKYGKIIGTQAIIRDFTKEKINRERIRRLNELNRRILENAPVGITVTNKQGDIILLNEQVKKSIDFDFHTLIGVNILNLKTAKNYPMLGKKYQDLLKKGEAFYYGNMPFYYNKGKNVKYFNIMAVPLLDEDNQINGALIMDIENTEAVRANERLEELNKSLEIKVSERTMELKKTNRKLSEVLELKSKFIADASHELRTPLTIIKGNLDLATQEKKLQGSKVPELYSILNKEIKFMTNILNDLTLLTNIDAGNEKLKLKKINLISLVKDVSQSMSIVAKNKNINFEFKRTENRLDIKGDEQKLKKLIQNLIKNAIKYNTKNGWIKIDVKKKKNIAEIIIQDNGIGIPKEDLPFIFERFYRVDKARTRAEGGTGLGLSISKWIAEAHGGKINVSSQVNKGSTFIIDLPFGENKKTASY